MFEMPRGPPHRWPKKEPDEDLDYTWDVEKVLRDRCAGAVDPLVSITLAVKPSGTGEMSYSRLSVNDTGFRVSVWLAGGVPGRDYTVNIKAVSQAGRKYQWPIGVEIDRFFAPSWPPPPAPCPEYGSELTWTADGTLANNTGFLALSSLGTWPTSSADLLPGALYAASSTAPSYIFAVPGFGYVEGPPLMFGGITAAALLAAGAMPLPPTDPHKLNQIWINGNIACVSQG